jgi:hypothetical protein
MRNGGKSMQSDDQRRIVDRVLQSQGIRLGRQALAGLELAAGRNLLKEFGSEQSQPAPPVDGGGEFDSDRRGTAVWTSWPLSRFDLPHPSVYLQFGEHRPCPLTGLFSSRLGRSLEKHSAWFAALRTTCLRLPVGDSILVAEDQTAFRFLRRLADTIPMELVVLCQTPAARLSKCLREIDAKRARSAPARITWMVRVVASAEQVLPDDSAVAELCHELRVLALRRGGNIDRLIGQQLQRPDSKRVLIRMQPDSPIPAHVGRLLDRGAMSWHVFDPAEPKETSETWPAADGAPVVPLAEIDPSRFLSHFTRRQHGAWEDEGENRFLDSLLFGFATSDRSAWATLLRIVLQCRLTAGSRLTRDVARVVCFTNRPLTDFAGLRIFRPHLARWDYEPYGIAIDRQVLARLGARPVSYGDTSTWRSLAAVDRPYFQLSQRGHADWSAEQEWRIVGDVDLDALAPGDAVIFVPSEEEAARMRPFSRWPVVVLGG